MSGRANVRHWLAAHGHDPHDTVLVEALLAAAQSAGHTLSDLACTAVHG